MIKNLKALRTSAHLSQQKLADHIFVSQQSINKYENHGVVPDLETLIKLADFFDVSVDYLIGNTENRERYDSLKASDLTAEEKRLVAAYRRLNETQRCCISRLLESYR